MGKDVAEALGYRDTSDALKKHVDEEDKGVGELPTPGGVQELVVMTTKMKHCPVYTAPISCSGACATEWLHHGVPTAADQSLLIKLGGDLPPTFVLFFDICKLYDSRSCLWRFRLLWVGERSRTTALRLRRLNPDRWADR